MLAHDAARRLSARRLWNVLRGVVVVGVVTGLLGTLEASASRIACGDDAWARRAVGARAEGPVPGPNQEAVDCYEAALEEEPGSIEARWKLLQALHFAGDFVPQAEADRRRVFERAREVAETGLDLLARRLDAGVRLEELPSADVEDRLRAAGLLRSDVARLHFWAAVNWGAWSRAVGLLAAVRSGAANRIHRYTEVAMRLEPAYHDGGALRLLGRLHAELPRVPLLTGWVDRERALPLVERAHSLVPENPGNQLLLALTLLDLAPARRAEALALLERVADLTPRDSMWIEELFVRAEARKRLGAEAPHLLVRSGTARRET